MYRMIFRFKITRWYITLWLLVTYTADVSGQRVMETGGKTMPDEWVDRDTRHKIIRLTRRAGDNASFYFHNYPFIESPGKDDLMVFYGKEGSNKQLFTVNLKTFEVLPLTDSYPAMSGEIVGRKGHGIYFQRNDSVFSVYPDTRKVELIYVFPADFKGSITTLNADETLLGGVRATDEEKKIFAQNPKKSDYFNKIYEARLPRTLFTIDIKAKKLTPVYQDSAWLNHVQFSPTDPALLMFCHEGPWHKVDRIWTINIHSKEKKLIHKRTMDMEIAGHEWFSQDGKTIWFDLQLPRGENFLVAGVDLKSGKEKRYTLERDQWSVHYTTSPDGKMFAGDGGDPGAVAKAKDGQWIYAFYPNGKSFTAERLVNMKHHRYAFEPNVHFTPDGEWIIFRANFEGSENVYAVSVKSAKKFPYKKNKNSNTDSN